MNKKKLAIGILGVAGVAALGYYAYQRSKGQAVSLPGVTNNQLPAASAQPVNTSQPAAATLSPYEGKGFRNIDNGRIYKVVNGVLRQLTTGAAMQRELGSDRYEQLVASGILLQVNTTFINYFTIGSPLSGISTSILI